MFDFEHTHQNCLHETSCSRSFSSFQNTCHLSTCLCRWCQAVTKTCSNQRRKEFSIHAPAGNVCIVATHVIKIKSNILHIPFYWGIVGLWFNFAVRILKKKLNAPLMQMLRQGQIWPKSTALTQPFLWHQCHDWIWQTYRNEANMSPCRLNKCARRITGRIGWRFCLIFLGIGSVGLWLCKEATSIFLPGSETQVPIENKKPVA